ncbi:MAG: hypothetical protein JRJ12_02180 [Deltaproteobacteria bacterium]|nr:hypothetical protein [Deltaproteobacteria bacterium]MBW2070080.1 hypothetical protein [Deltaproteobacteria bacterium]
MSLKSLAQLKRKSVLELPLHSLPEKVQITAYAKNKAYRTCELIKEIFKDSFEWYGFTLASKDNPEVITDVGLPRDQANFQDHTELKPESIAAFLESLPSHLIVNGWIHSHGELQYEMFSEIDRENHLTVLDYVSPLVRRPVAKKELVIRDLVLLRKDHYSVEDLRQGSVCLVTDKPVEEAMVLETIYGSFCYCIVIGDKGWHSQEIYYKKRGILSGEVTIAGKEAEMTVVDSALDLSPAEVRALAGEIAEKIKPVTSPPPELIERM